MKKPRMADATWRARQDTVPRSLVGVGAWRA